MTGRPSTMVVHVAKRGKDMPGLMRYLYGPGKANEHIGQRMVAGSLGLEMAYAGALTPSEAGSLGQVMQMAWRREVIEQLAVAGQRGTGISSETMSAGIGSSVLSHSDKEHVYHLIVSLPPGEHWTDEQWATVAADIVGGMGFTGGAEDTKGCRWAAIRHGQSANGNDHLHIAVNLIRQDGRRARLPENDFRLAQQVRQQIEQRREFVLPLHDHARRPGISLPGYTMAEHQRSRRRAAETGQEVPDRVMLQQAVRAAAVASSTEAEWIGRVLDAHPDMQLEAARWAPGGRETVTGYKVRLGDDAPWFSASSLAPDLTLTKLRSRWAANETDASHAEARAAWREEAPPTRLPVESGPEAALDEAQRQLERWNSDLRTLDPLDRQQWRETVGEAAGVASTMARLPGAAGEQLALVGNTLARQTLAIAGDTQRAPVVSHGPSPAQLAARQMQLALRAGGAGEHLRWLAVLQQLRATLQAVQSAQQARGELVAARQLAAGAIELVDEVQAGVGQRGAGIDPEVAAVQQHRSHTQAVQEGRATGTTDLRPTPGSPSPGLDQGEHRRRL